jgi:hypothetical protein
METNPNMCDIFRLKATMSQKRIVETMYKDEGKDRKCLSCDKTFFSTFKGNRICNDCKESKERVKSESTDWDTWESNLNYAGKEWGGSNKWIS